MKKIIKGIKSTISTYKENKKIREKLKENIKKGEMYKLYSMWINADSKVQIANKKLFSQIIKKIDYVFIPDLVKKTNNNVIKKTIKTIIKSETEFKKVSVLWRSAGAHIRKENADLFPEIVKKFQKHQDFDYIWLYTDKEIKNKYEYLFPSILANAQEDDAIASIIIDATHSIINNNKLLIKNSMRGMNNGYFNHVWQELGESFQRENVDLLIDRIQTLDNKDDIERIWIRTKLEKDKIKEVFESVDYTRKAYIWGVCGKNFQKENGYLLEGIFEETEDPYLLAYILMETKSNITELNKMKIPEDLKKIVLGNFQEKNNLFGEYYIDPQPLLEALTVAISDWDSVKEYLQRKKASSILNDGIEVRKNSFREIVDAGKVLHSPIPNNASAQELMLAKGSERIGTDTKYNKSVSTTWQRAFDLARRMDEESTIKKYPDFSVKSMDEGINLHVLHPQDKSAILLGYDTKCCFRPNGNADNSAQTEYSLLQYCLTTPYGGVLRCDDVQNNTVYMGSPFLINGNCLMLHSYETANGRKSKEVNKLLIEAAKKAIQDSKGSIDIVFMTDLNTDDGLRLDVSDKIIIPSYFKSYTENEYRPYEKMYNNLEHENCILAARIGNDILTGNELVRWYEEECKNDPDQLISLLNLHMGERESEWDFGRRRIKEKIEVPEVKLVQAFLERKQELEKKREEIAVKLHDAPDEEKDRFRVELKKNREEQLRVYSGEDIDLVAKIYHIDMEHELRKKAEESLKNKKTKDKNKVKEGYAIGAIISDIRKSNNKSIMFLVEKVKNKTISSNELELLKQADIDVSLYEKVLNANAINNDSQEQKIEAEINQKVRKEMKDVSKKEKIVSEILFKDVKKEEIKTKSKKILNVSLGDELRRKTAKLKKGKMIETLTEAEKLEVNEEVQKMNLKSLVSAIVEENISDEQQQVLDELANGEYQLDLSSHIKKIGDIEKLKRDIRSDKMAKLKAMITIGMDTKQKISIIKGKIDGTRSINSDCTSLVYGNSWYVALDENSNIVETKINSEIDEKGLEKDYYEEILAGYQEKENKRIKTSDIREIVQDISINDKEKAKMLIDKNEKQENVIKM